MEIFGRSGYTLLRIFPKLTELEAKARESGLKTLRLETNRTLEEARSLYRNEGFREVEPFNDEPYAHYWFEKP